MMRLATRLGVMLLALSPLACSAAEQVDYKHGEHYYSVRKAQPPVEAGKIEVAEVFWYGCGHCKNFDPYIERWHKTAPGDVEFKRIPSSLGRPVGLLHSKAYYTAENLGVLDAFHGLFFASIHDRRQPMSTPAAIAGVFERIGIDKDRFESNFHGFAVDNRVRRAETLVRDFGITSVPSVVVDGRWYSNATLAGGNYEKLLKVIDHLVVKARQERGK